MNRHSLAILAALALAASACAASVDVRDYGAKGNSLADDSAAIQKALDAAAESGGGEVELGVGRFRLDTPITVPEGVTLSGVWEAPHHAQLTKGTVFEVYASKDKEDDPPLITLKSSSAVKGITFFYPEQRIPRVATYPYTVSGRATHCSVIDCTFVNSYKAMEFGGSGNELHYVRNCFGCPLKVGIHIENCSDVGRVENVHFNPHYWMRAAERVRAGWPGIIKYLRENLVAFDFGRTDWEYVNNTFCYGAKIGYHFYRSETGSPNGNFLGIGADMCETPVLVEDCEPQGILITNGEFVASDRGRAFLDVAPTNAGTVQLSNCSFWGPCATVALVEGTGTVSLNQCTFHNHGEPKDAWTIDARGGDLIVIGCRFGNKRPDIRLGNNVKTAVITGNVFLLEKRIENLSEGDVQEGLNVVRK